MLKLLNTGNPQIRSTGWFPAIITLISIASYFGLMRLIGLEINDDIRITLFAIVAAYFANLTAIGGGFVFMPLFSIFYSIAPTTALSLSIITQSFGMTAGSIGWRVRNFDFEHLKVAFVVGGLGMIIGTLMFKPDVALTLQYFGVLSLILGGISLFVFTKNLIRTKSQIANTDSNHRMLNKLDLYSISYTVFCFFGGVFTAWTSIGIGEIVAVWLIVVARRPLEVALASGVAALAFCSVIGAGLHVGIIKSAPWNYLVYTIPGVLIGGYLGATTGRVICSCDNVNGWKFRISLKMLFSIVILADSIYILLVAK